MTAFADIESLIDEIRQGRMIVMLDDEDRENEGDLIMAAACVRPEDINFMARYGRGLICLTLTRERCEHLRLPLMVGDTDARHETNFTVSIDAARGITTGISAADRALTIRAAVAPDALHDDLVQPGHVFPLMSQAGGVLTRAGHTEAGSDLARLAGYEAASVIVEILNEDGTMARGAELERFAREHGLLMGTVADLIRYRLEHERTVEQLSRCALGTRYGAFTLHAFRDAIDGRVHLALVHGDWSADEVVTVRVHMEDAIADAFELPVREGRWTLTSAMREVVDRGAGVVVVLRQGGDDEALLRRIRSLQGASASEAGGDDDAEPMHDLRTYGVGAQILVALGIRRMRVLGSPLRLHGLSGYGLEIVEYVPSRVPGPSTALDGTPS